MSKVYEPHSVEGRIYDWWQEKGYFKPEVHPEGKAYTIMMPPPNITGQLHMGHAFDDTLQDVLTRFKRMQGYAALWVPGMDHASIATEVKVVDKIRNEEGKTKEDLGRDEFLKRAWDWAITYRDRIREQVKKLGASCDWDRERFTMDEGCSEAVKDTFIRLYEEGLIYKGSRIINWCPDCKTALSDAEVEYQEENGHLWHIRYPFEDGEGYVTVATTRPETMLGDSGVAVNPKDERYTDLVGKNVILPIVGKAIPVVADDYVDMEFGTGVVKMTPAHDPNDYEVGKRHNLEEINVMNENGTMNALAGEKYAGMDRYACRKAVLADLEALGLLEKVEEHVHNVGHCYRCSTTVETMTSEQWFVKMAPLAGPAIDAVRNGDTKFVPDRFSKIYFNWMENIRDWCISRQLWWGHRIPAYTCDACGELVVAKEKPEVCPKCGGSHFTQDPDALDTWFSSALWPFSTLGWPRDTADLEKFYPNAVLVTGYDIIFFWVARMIFMGLYNMGEAPFSDVYIHGLIRDSQGRKMSKSLGNGIDPLEIIEEYSADALRFAIITGNSAGNDIRWQDEKVESSRNFLNKVWNATRFVLMNLEDDIMDQQETAMANLEATDKWILSRMNTVVGEVTQNMEKYELGIAAQKIYDFTWSEYCDWYIELVKPRLYGEDEGSKLAAEYTLNTVLTTILKLLHPVVPFITEEIYAYLPGSGEAIIVAKWPEYDEALSYPQEEKDVVFLMEVIRNIRNIRAEADVPNSRKAELYFMTDNAEHESLLMTSEALLEKLASVSGVKTIEKDAVGDGFISAVIEDAEIFLSLEDLVDKEKEIARLQNEKKKIEKELARLNGKLGNEGFLKKAPEQVVAAEREKLAGYTEMMAKVEDRLAYFEK
ncbi:MAG: valine--tRNA ligase [Eubacterium aggregans]|uniref:valine--tRNA ligase n=1 Tax=Eubacterium aggregans TaxID=81409 RepID=UPI002B217F22|nr:valine--tRNA ligase [Eubacterium aggregans]MEA5072778.1 valine--tRNA ligase [Eubacterium aggregans]